MVVDSVTSPLEGEVETAGHQPGVEGGGGPCAASRPDGAGLPQINPASGEDGSAYFFFGMRPAV